MAFITVGLLGLVGLAEVPAGDGEDAEWFVRRIPWLWMLLSGVGFGLAVMSKGPVPVATVAVPYAVWVVIFHRWRWDIWLAFSAGRSSRTVAVCAVAAGRGAHYPQAWKV